MGADVNRSSSRLAAAAGLGAATGAVRAGKTGVTAGADGNAAQSLPAALAAAGVDPKLAQSSEA